MTTMINRPGGSDIISIQRLLLMMRRNWYFYLIAILVGGAGTYLYIKYKIPTYSVGTTILIEEGNATPGEDMLEGFAVRPGVQNLDNQILIISSYNIVRKTIEELPFEINVYRKGFKSQASYYPLSPLRIMPGPGGLPYEIEFIFEYVLGESFRITTSSNSSFELDTTLAFGESININNRSFIIYPQPELEEVYKSEDKIYIQFYNKERLTETYMRRLDVENATRGGSIVRLSLQGTNRIKNIMFLDKLTEVYINNNLEKKNQKAKRTIDFIDEQLIDVSDSLIVTETKLQEFRSRNLIMDVSAQATQIINQSVVLENEKARLSLESNYYKYLDDYLSSDHSVERAVAPASMGIEDPLLANLLQELAGLQAQYFSSGAGERNPLQGQLEMRIRNTKQSIRETLSGIMLANKMAIEENSEQINRLNIEAAKLPIKERQLLGFERKFNLNNVLYTYLLQSRAEAQIQRASNTPDNELVDSARNNGLVSPISQKAYAFALALAMVIPTLILLFASMLQNKITCEEDVSLISQHPILAHFPHSKLSYNTVVFTEPNSRISEAFRSLRTRMEFFTKNKKCPLLVVSSSMPGEGKTFTAINLASAYCLAGKRTLLIGFDLRRPTLSKSFDLNGETGLTNYLIGEKSLSDVIYETDFANLHIIPAGTIPPNPGELTGSEKAKNLFSILKDRYDYIIVDSPPIGVVSDIYPIAALSDVVLLLIRHGHTQKNVLSATLSEVEGNGINGLSLLINDVKSRGNSYRYAYKYKYEYQSKRK